MIQKEEIKERAKLMLVMLVVGFPFIILRLFLIQVVDYPEYSQAAAKNLDRYRELPPKRGTIYDRHHRLLAKTSPSYDLYVQLKGVVINPDSQKTEPELNMPTIERVQKLLSEHGSDITLEELTAKITRYYQKACKEIARLLEPDQELAQKRPRKYKRKKTDYEKDWFGRKFLIVTKLPHSFAQEIFCENAHWECDESKANIQELYPGFCLTYSIAREYPEKTVACQLLGAIGPIPDSQRISLIEKYDYRSNDEVGLEGIEKLLEHELRGKRGYLVNSQQGQFVEKAMDGLDVELTIDAHAQKLAEEALDEMIQQSQAKGGAAVVISVETGEILVLASSPRYDINQRRYKYNELLHDPQEPLLNRAIALRHTTPPGSVFKVAVALYALEAGIINKHDLFECRGFMYDRGKFRCTHHHGKVNVVQAIEGSCNVFFYHVGEKMGWQNLMQCAKYFGFGSKSGIGFVEESAGRLPPKGTPGEDRMFAIGQRLEATPLQIARSMAMIARRGSMPQLQIVRRYLVPAKLDESTLEPSKLISQFGNSLWQCKFSEENWDLVMEGMRRVTAGHDGTAQNVGKLIGDIEIASKTGTSQVSGRKDHGWFAGFAPFRNPQYAFVVYIEHGGYGGQCAGPVAAKILKYFLTPQTELIAPITEGIQEGEGIEAAEEAE